MKGCFIVDNSCGECMAEKHLPPEFLSRLRQLEQAYLTSKDPVQQSGFSGAERDTCWNV